MERFTGSHLTQAFADLDKDPGSRRRSMNSLRNYVQQLDGKVIHQYIAQLSELQDGHLPVQNLISLYEVIAREHGKIIIPQITKMMGDVLKALSSNAPSLALQQVCAKTVSAMARYTIDPSSFQAQREGVIRDLANPLLDVLLGTVQSLAEGAALCLQALVETEAWKYAPDDIVNEICLRVTGALEEKGTQTNSHMKLVCSLAKSNSPILEAYGRSLLKAAAKILETGVVTRNSQQRLHAVLMIDGLLKSVDMDILASEIPNTVMYLEKCRSDRTPSVRNLVSETTQLAKALASEMGIDLNNDDSYSDDNEEIPCEGNASSRGSFRGFNDFSPDMQIGLYTHSPVSSMQSLNTKYQIPSITGSGTRAKGSSNFDLSRGYYSDSIDKNAFSGKMRNLSFSSLSDRSESARPNAGRNMAKEQTPPRFFSRTGKDGDCRRYLVPESHFFDKGGDRNISLENGIMSRSDAEIAAEYQSDGASEKKYSCEHVDRQTRTRVNMFDRHGENGDASTYNGDCFERSSYMAENDPCFSFCVNCTHSLSPSDVEEEAVSPKNPGSSITIDDMSVFDTPRAFVRSLEQHSSDNTCRKLLSRREFADSAEANYDSLNEADWTMNLNPAANDTANESRGGDHGQMIPVKRGSTALDSLYNIADGYSVRSNSEEGDLQNSSEWSESVHRTDSLSPTSSTVFEEILDNEEYCQSTGLAELDKGAPRTDDKKENCLPASVNSVEGSTDSFEWQETNTFCACWRRASRFMESILGVCLCAVLAVPATMVAVKLFNMQEEYHVMVPT